MYKKDLNYLINLITDKAIKDNVIDWYSLLGFIETNKLSGYVFNKIKEKKIQIPKLIYSNLYNIYSCKKLKTTLQENLLINYLIN